VGYERIETEHAAPKNGGGMWMMPARRKQAPSANAGKPTKATVLAQLPKDAGTIAS
jgi:hypothetical protein